MSTSWADAVLAETFRHEHGRVLSVLIRDLGGFDIAEEALADAVSQATTQWRRDGVPDRPGAWLLSVARRRGRDRLRRSRTLDRKLPALVEPDEAVTSGENTPLPDERLRLVFTCCHPALSPEARIALTLRTVAGLTTAEIASAFLVSEEAMTRRLTRAKTKIRDAGIPYRVPDEHDLADRLDGVLHVLELVFNEGYTASHGDALVRRDLTREATRLARLLLKAVPGEPEVEGLLALFLLQESRATTRVDNHGLLVRLEDQDRMAWNHEQITEGVALVEQALRRRRVGPYQLRAAIAAVHAEAPSFADTDWHEIAGLYATLAKIDGSPVVQLNGAVAISYAISPEAGLKLVEPLAESLDAYHLFHATRAELLLRVGRPTEAADAFARAIELADNEIERAHLAARLAEAAG